MTELEDRKKLSDAWAMHREVFNAAAANADWNSLRLAGEPNRMSGIPVGDVIFFPPIVKDLL